jgi:uncharacterized protein
MSEENKAILQMANEAITRLDFEGFLVHCTEDTEWTFVGEQTIKGKAAVREWMNSSYKEPPEFRVDRMIAEGDWVVAMGEIMLRGKDGKKTRHLYSDVWRFEGQRMKELRAFVIQPA